ncbi:MAG: c-type cytochrome biogenesis protein CcmI [Deltaproteobacteria bacterium]
MLLWFVFSVLTAGVVGTLLWWYRRAPADGLDADADVFVYADQLSQIDADLAKGLLTVTEAESARAEVGRRLLARAAASAKADTEGSRGSARLAVAAAVSIPVAALALYVALGSPGLPDVPHAGRSEVSAARDGVEAMIARVEDRLRAAPEDGNGWDVIAPIYLRLERYGKAAEAFANANRLLGETPKRLAGFAQAEILANNGIVNANAKIAAERLLALEPGRLDARMWLALAKEQDGRFNEALAEYRALLSAPQMTPAMTSAVEVRIAAVERLARGEKIEPGQDTAEATQIRPPQPADQQAMIEGMVARLASRLQTDGNDPAGWVQLMRSYKVLGRNDDAVKALQDARKALAGKDSLLDEINRAAAELGIAAALKGSEPK